MARPNPNKQGKSPYRKYDKLPYTYSFGRCAHNHTHSDRHDGVTYEVCNACNGIQKNSLTEALKKGRPVVEEEVLKAA